LLGDLCALDSDSALRRRLRHYARPHLLVIDEVGYLSYSNRHADLMFELISRRYQNRSTLVTTNRNFAEWREVFPNAVRLALERQREQLGGEPPVAIVMPAHVRDRDASVRPHALETYDQLKDQHDATRSDN